MTTKQTKQFLGGDSYISPEIRTVEFSAEGMLCLSIAAYGALNHAGNDLEEDNVWDF